MGLLGGATSTESQATGWRAPKGSPSHSAGTLQGRGSVYSDWLSAYGKVNSFQSGNELVSGPGGLSGGRSFVFHDWMPNLPATTQSTMQTPTHHPRPRVSPWRVLRPVVHMRPKVSEVFCEQPLVSLSPKKTKTATQSQRHVSSEPKHKQARPTPK